MIDDIFKHFGSQSALAELLNIDRAAVSQWWRFGIPPLRMLQIEKLSGGKFTAASIHSAETKRLGSINSNTKV